MQYSCMAFLDGITSTVAILMKCLFSAHTVPLLGSPKVSRVI